MQPFPRYFLFTLSDGKTIALNENHITAVCESTDPAAVRIYTGQTDIYEGRDYFLVKGTLKNIVARLSGMPERGE